MCHKHKAKIKVLLQRAMLGWIKMDPFNSDRERKKSHTKVKYQWVNTLLFGAVSLICVTGFRGPIPSFSLFSPLSSPPPLIICCSAIIIIKISGFSLFKLLFMPGLLSTIFQIKSHFLFTYFMTKKITQISECDRERSKSKSQTFSLPIEAVW